MHANVTCLRMRWGFISVCWSNLSRWNTTTQACTHCKGLGLMGSCSGRLCTNWCKTSAHAPEGMGVCLFCIMNCGACMCCLSMLCNCISHTPMGRALLSPSQPQSPKPLCVRRLRCTFTHNAGLMDSYEAPMGTSDFTTTCMAHVDQKPMTLWSPYYRGPSQAGFQHGSVLCLTHPFTPLDGTFTSTCLICWPAASLLLLQKLYSLARYAAMIPAITTSLRTPELWPVK